MPKPLAPDYADKRLAAAHPSRLLQQAGELFRERGHEIVSTLFDIAKDTPKVSDQLKAIELLAKLSGLAGYSAAIGVLAAKQAIRAGEGGDGTLDETDEDRATREHLEAALPEDAAEDAGAGSVGGTSEGAGEPEGVLGDGVARQRGKARASVKAPRGRVRVPRKGKGG